MKQLLLTLPFFMLLVSCGDDGKTIIRTTGAVTEYELRSDSGTYHVVDSPFIFTPSFTTYNLHKNLRYSDRPCRDCPYSLVDSRHSRWMSDCMMKVINDERKVWKADGWQVVKYDTIRDKGGTDVDWLRVVLRKSELIEVTE